MDGKLVAAVIVSVSAVPAGAYIRPMSAAAMLVFVMCGVTGIELFFGILCLDDELAACVGLGVGRALCAAWRLAVGADAEN
ncbi:MAG: hypothetical protein R3C45_01715 [Phycisphaerales bacterium]